MKPRLWYKALSDARGRREKGFFIVEGRRAVGQVLSTAPRSVEELLVTGPLHDHYRNTAYPVRVLTARQFDTVCASKTPQGVAAVVKIPPGSYGDRLPEKPGEMVLLLEGLQDPGNVGALVRTAAAFGYSGVILSGTSADPFSPKAVQASAGSLLSLWIRKTDRYRDLAEVLKGRGCALIAADLRGEPLKPGFRLPGQHILILGSEASGLSAEILALADRAVRIPINSAKAESLNVAASGAVMMFLSK